MRHRLILPLVVLLGGLLLPAIAGARVPDTLRVGTKPAPPFAMRDAGGSWHGISIDLWRGIAADLGVVTVFEERDLEGLFDGVEDGSLDLAVAALTVTADRETRFDFSHPFHATGLGIAVESGQGGSGWVAVGRRFVSLDFVKVLVPLAGLLLIFGLLVWVFERRANPGQFGGGPASGIGSGFWWAAVTMTTVGYGDKAPVTPMGRILGLVWMFVAIIVISSFTAAITSSLTVSSLGPGIEGPEDLGRVRVGSVTGSSSADALAARGIGFRSYPAAAAALDGLAAGDVEAVVHDAPLLQYLARTDHPGAVTVLDRTFDRQDYAILLPRESALREPVNRALLERVRSPEWRRILTRYLGS